MYLVQQLISKIMWPLPHNHKIWKEQHKSEKLDYEHNVHITNVCSNLTWKSKKELYLL